MHNHFTCHGRLTRDPDVRYTSGEKSMAVARITLAVSRPGKDKGADYPQFIAFGKLAETFEKYLKKGNEVLFVGHIQTSNYEKNGEKIYNTDLIVDSFDFCGTKDSQAGIAPPNAFEGFAEETDLPF